MVSNVLIAFAGLTLLAGLWMTVRGVRGLRVGDAPYCRKCGFNLSGSPPDAGSCPECGYALTGPKAIRRGERHRRRKTLAAGVAVLLLTLSVAGLETARRTSYTTLLPHLPDTYLLWVHENDIQARDELVNRLLAGQLTRSEVDQLTATALKIQGDRTVPWDKAWGRIIEQAWVNGQLSQKRAERYLKQAVELRFKVRPKVQLGRKLFGMGDGEVSRFGDAKLRVDYEWDEIRLNGEPPPIEITRHGGSFSHTSSSAYHKPALFTPRWVTSYCRVV